MCPSGVPNIFGKHECETIKEKSCSGRKHKVVSLVLQGCVRGFSDSASGKSVCEGENDFEWCVSKRVLLASRASAFVAISRIESCDNRRGKKLCVARCI